MSSTHLDPVKNWMREFDRIHDHTVSKRDMFRDFCEMGYCAYAKLMALWHHDQERADQLEARYMQIVGKYKNKDTVRAFKPLLELVFDALEGGGTDFLGQVSSQLEILDAGHGQFFTPYNLSRMMADISLFGYEQFVEEKGYITLNEPACGAGGMILACADALQHAGYDPMRHMLVQATDISAMCYHMTYLQFTARGIPALVFRGDTLRATIAESAWTIHAPIFQHYHGHLDFNPPTQLSVWEYA